MGLYLGWKEQWICCVTRGREGREVRVGRVEGRGGEGRGGEGRGGEERGGEGRGGGEGGEGREGGSGGMTVIHILMAPQYVNSNHVTYYVIT